MKFYLMIGNTCNKVNIKPYELKVDEIVHYTICQKLIKYKGISLKKMKRHLCPKR